MRSTGDSGTERDLDLRTVTCMSSSHTILGPGSFDFEAVCSMHARARKAVRDIPRLPSFMAWHQQLPEYLLDTLGTYPLSIC